MPSTVQPTLVLCRRELIRFIRQRSRIIGVIGSPVVFWFLIGSGLGSSFRHPAAPAGMNYLEYFFPGTIILVILFTSIFSSISVIEDRREGFLQGVLVSPISRTSIALGKILGATVLALLQAVILLVIVPFLGISLDLLAVFAILGVLFVVAFGLSALGFLIAWRMDSTQGFHAVMNLFLIPLWLLSGALFPASGAAGWIATVMRLNPLSYGVAALRQVLYLGGHAVTGELASLGTSLTVVGAFGLASLIAAAAAVGREGARP